MHPRTNNAARYPFDDPNDPVSTDATIVSCSDYTHDTDPFVITLDLHKTYWIDIVVVIGEEFTRLTGRWEVFIGNSTAYD